MILEHMSSIEVCIVQGNLKCTLVAAYAGELKPGRSRAPLAPDGEEFQEAVGCVGCHLLNDGCENRENFRSYPTELADKANCSHYEHSGI